MPKFRTTIVRNVLYEETVEYVTEADNVDDINLNDSTFFLIKSRKELEIEPVSLDVEEVRHFPATA